MNNPDKNEIDGDTLKAGVTEDASQSLFISRIDIPLYASTTIFQPEYKLFETKESLDHFFIDFDDTQNWKKSIDDANISYQHNNLLFYPITQSKDCGLRDTIFVNDKNATITIDTNLTDCKDSITQFVLWYKISKDLENITVKAFDEEPDLIQL